MSDLSLPITRDNLLCQSNQWRVVMNEHCLGQMKARLLSVAFGSECPGTTCRLSLGLGQPRRARLLTAGSVALRLHLIWPLAPLETFTPTLHIYGANEGTKGLESEGKREREEKKDNLFSWGSNYSCAFIKPGRIPPAGPRLAWAPAVCVSNLILHLPATVFTLSARNPAPPPGDHTGGEGPDRAAWSPPCAPPPPLPPPSPPPHTPHPPL